MKNHILPSELLCSLPSPAAPAVIDVRRLPAFEKSEHIIAAAVWRDHLLAGDWGGALSRKRDVVVYCVHGQQVSQAATALLRAQGIRARYLQGGFDAWEAAGGATAARAQLGAHQGKSWVTPENPQLDCIACVWLIRRFIDPAAVVHYVEADWLGEIAAETGALIFAAKSADSPFAPARDGNSLDAFIRHLDLRDAALPRMSAIVRGAEAESAGLAALVGGLSAEDDARRVEQGMLLFDALYRWCRAAA